MNPAHPKTQASFLALWPPHAQRLELSRLLRVEVSNGRASHPQDLHLTLVFLGVLDDERQACVEGIAGSIPAPPMTLRLDQLGYWKGPRILWAAPSDPPEALLDLAARLRNALDACGFRPEHRPFAPHLTLARKARPTQIQSLERPITWPVDGFVLATGQSGCRPRYRILRTWSATQSCGEKTPSDDSRGRSG